MAGFSSRRGRPANNRTSADFGTPELIFKRAHAETMEAIDLCRERRIITADQHWCGLHLRWLYTLRYGAPGVSAVDLTRIDGYAMAAAEDSPVWRAAREAEFAHAITLLRTHRRCDLVMQVCVFNERPVFLRREALRAAFDTPQIARTIARELDQFISGMDLLVREWKSPQGL
ncbi:MAG: hypothetical protein ACOYKQ_13815 [Polymorphobacter sp.]